MTEIKATEKKHCENSISTNIFSMDTKIRFDGEKFTLHIS